MEIGHVEMVAKFEDPTIIIQNATDVVGHNSNQGGKYFVVTEVSENPEKLAVSAGMEVLDATAVIDQRKSWGEICRICANTNDYLIPIFEGEGLEQDLHNKIHRYLPIQVSEEDNLPLRLCYHCAGILLAWHELVEDCLEAERTLLQMESELKQKNQLTSLENSLDEECPGSTVLDTRISFKRQLPEEQLAVRGDCNEAVTTIDARRSRRIQMPFKVFLERQNMFWKPYEKSNLRANKKAVSEDDTESIWIAVTESAVEQPQKASDPLQFGDTSLQDSHLLHNTESTRKCLKSDVRETIMENRGADNNCVKTMIHSKQSTDHLNIQKGIPDIQGSYQCSECRKHFKLKDSYQRHIRIHTNERPFTCHVCAKQFRDSGGLSRHLKDVHAKLKNFPCDMCGKSFASKATREDHRRTHTGERPYICESCGSTFKSKASLYIHSKLHTNEFPHPCSYCHKKFRRKQEMLAHITTHTGEKNHACEVCSKRFRVKSELVRHQLVHSEEKPFICSKCSLAFRQKRYLNNHIKSRHIDTS
ncbi:zinc finger protein with KRAB and SCAN domains 8-like isoform X1 [Neodiprion lecontei]|uniref:Zinc finger protein with KRAB and SCAN domains 8-like isoform X1 n=1 Tax=Neodiprion lecontei TaxID=441921 RepID=A0ABM3FUP8_NEOLC|nr:zinc finger protein with KRAB and SCAN domains 8-like isoform X1 [Neodiprion lecontei]XP_046591739.1 zinc finger protein with KRAB and SCAN domains 8-like isoform X1 [Neodiprion lecontei]